MKWIFAILMILVLSSCSDKKEEITENYSSETIEAAQEMYEASAEDLTEDQLDEAQQQEVDAATNNCMGDCSGHQAGYEWAEENGISSESDCDGNSDSFNEGCTNFVDGGSGY
jgi:outer membrane protein assembly factor BamD (BamD/ComL family)